MKIKRRYYLLYIVFFVIGCNNPNVNKIQNETKDFGIIYFIDGDVTTIISIDCDNYLNELKSSISYLKIEDKEFCEKMLLTDYVQDSLDYQQQYIDVRYRLEMNDMVLCIDDFGYCYVNNEYKGKLNSFQALLNYIEVHKAESSLYDKNSILSIEVENRVLKK